MTSLNLTKISELMSPLERVKLIISLELKAFGEMGTDRDKWAPFEKEIELVVKACPPSQSREYNFLIGLKGQIWKRLWTMIELHQSHLEVLDSWITLTRFLLAASPSVNNCLQLVKKQFATIKQVDSDSLEEVTLEKERDVIINHLESMLSVSIDGTNIKLANPIFERNLISFKQQFTQTVNDIHGYISLIEKIEQKHFGGMEVVSRSLADPTGVIPKALAKIDRIFECHNRYLGTVVEGFNLMSMGSAEYHSDQLSELMLRIDPEINKEWVERELVWAEEVARI